MAERAFVAGDFHLGAGSQDPLESFDQDEKFTEFVASIAAHGTTLVLNGDFVDFPQIPPFDIPPPLHLLWTEDVSLAKLRTAVSAHPTCFGALARFLSLGGKLVVLIGNHDLDLAWPEVQKAFRAAVGNPGPDALRFTVGECVFHGVWIEHGHEFTPENCPQNPRQFFHEYRAASEAAPTHYLERVWGTDFMLRFYNDLKRTHHYADAVKPMLTVLWHSLMNGWVRGSELVRLLVFLKSRSIPWSAVSSSVLSAPDAAEAPQLVLGSIDDGDWRELVMQRIADERFQAELAEGLKQLTREDLRRVQDGDSVSIEVASSLETLAEPAKVLGLFRESREHRAAKARLAQAGITAVVLGHTHEIVDGALLSASLKNCLFNPGTWLPRLNLASAHVQAKLKKDGLTEAMLQDPTLYTAERKAVLIEEDPGHASHVRLVDCP